MKSNQFKYEFAQFSRLLKPLFNNHLMIFALLLPVLLLVTSCSQSSSEKAAEVGGVTAQQIIENPSAYVGKTVTVSGDVEEIHGPRAFNMDSGASVGELLVVGREPFPQLPDAGDRVYVINDVATVTGVIRMLNPDSIKNEIGWDLDSNLLSEFNGKPVLVAQSTKFRAGNGNTTTATAKPKNDQTMTNMSSDQTMTNMSSDHSMTNNNLDHSANGNEITDYLMLVTTPNRQSLVGKRVNLNNLKVQSVVGDRTFYVGPSESQRVFVVLDQKKTPNDATEGKYDINAGQTISLIGTVEKMPSVEEAKQRFGRLMDPTELNKLKDQQILVHTTAAEIKK